MLSPEDLSKLFGKVVDFIFAQTLPVILLLASTLGVGYLYIKSLHQNELLQQQLIKAHQENQLIQKEGYEARINELKQSMSKTDTTHNNSKK